MYSVCNIKAKFYIIFVDNVRLRFTQSVALSSFPVHSSKVLSLPSTLRTLLTALLSQCTPHVLHSPVLTGHNHHHWHNSFFSCLWWEYQVELERLRGCSHSCFPSSTKTMGGKLRTIHNSGRSTMDKCLRFSTDPSCNVTFGHLKRWLLGECKVQVDAWTIWYCHGLPVGHTDI